MHIYLCLPLQQSDFGGKFFFFSSFQFFQKQHRAPSRLTSAVLITALHVPRFSHHQSVREICSCRSLCSFSITPISSFRSDTICIHNTHTVFKHNDAGNPITAANEESICFMAINKLLRLDINTERKAAELNIQRSLIVCAPEMDLDRKHMSAFSRGESTRAHVTSWQQRRV